MQAKNGHIAKFMPQYDGLYDIIQAYPENSSYKLVLPPTSKAHPMFHIAHLQSYIPNNDTLFPEQASNPPKPLVLEGHYSAWHVRVPSSGGNSGMAVHCYNCIFIVVCTSRCWD